jgi:hypothetical protein
VKSPSFAPCRSFGGPSAKALRRTSERGPAWLRRRDSGALGAIR